VVLGSQNRDYGRFSLTGLLPSLVRLSSRLQLTFLHPGVTREPPAFGPATPGVQRSRPYTYAGFGLFLVRSPLLKESRLISFPRGTKMFQFPRLPSFRTARHYPRKVSPFGHPRIDVRSQLPGAYRSLPRPSSSLGAKASTMCP
jgi:hypothetical protein